MSSALIRVQGRAARYAVAMANTMQVVTTVATVSYTHLTLPTNREV